MVAHIPKTPIHWSLLAALETDLIEVSRFVEINESNFRTYSIELARLLLSIGAEIDSVAKELCKKSDPTCNPKNILQYSEIILQNYPFLSDVSVFFNRYDIEIKPWEDWGKDTSPSWWREHTSLKHSRSSEFTKANLGNVLCSLSALFSLCVCLYQELAEKGLLSPPSSILSLSEPFKYAMCVTDLGGYTTAIKFP